MEAEEAGQPHEALFLVLPYLPLFDLLALTQVCTSLRDAVHMDVLPWLELVIENPLSRKLSDDILLKFTSKASGRLRILSLSNCSKITDDGLLRVIQDNPLIEKLFVAGCTSLSPEGILDAVKTLISTSNRLRCLRINGIYNLNKDHLQPLQFYLELNQTTLQEPQVPAPIFFHDHGDSTRVRECNSRSIDVEICPKCDEVRMVFSCPRETCKECRGCIFCIPRCAECGVCVDASEETEEAVCGDLLCSACWVQLKPKCSFCNRPYCRQHRKQETRCSSGPHGFVCGVCNWEYIENMSNGKLV
ncbi:F-box protein SKIP28-like [Punica granatum]|uniref:F-box domain-containing protein n=2 Tax=Punica granatum TaxID=22663 RepID=A0A218WWB7_PUNGR|nr:F-box protein SKIP28-like [Punica granatum]OWM76650.1 hypothetical protein CDL15_Pgr009215 [Punica granatum]PKI48589.1 hypothetical protein CRG98_031008 [Punica granatum]